MAKIHFYTRSDCHVCFVIYVCDINLDLISRNL